MKQIFTSIFSLLIYISSVAQTAPWVSFFGGPGSQFATDIKQTTDNGFIVSAFNNEGNSPLFYVVKLNEAGEIEWEKNINKDNYAERAYSVIETSNNEFIIIGTAGMLRQPWIVRLTAQGDTVWTSQWSHSMPQNSAIIARGTVLNDDRIVVIGAEGQLGTRPNMLLVSADGSLIEQRSLNAVVPPGWYSGTIVNHIEKTMEGGFILTGTAGTGSGSKAFLWKFNFNADSVWTFLYNGQGQGMRSASSVKQLPDGGYVMAGFSSPNSEHSCAMRVDANGEVIWFKVYPDNVYTQATDIVLWEDGGFLITEKRFTAVGESIFESAIVRIDSEGNLINREIITADGIDVGLFRIQNTTDGGFVIAGEINPTGIMNEQDLFVLKSDPSGSYNTSFFNVLVSARTGKDKNWEDAFRIMPNPIKTHHVFTAQIAEETKLIELYSAKGSMISRSAIKNRLQTELTAPDKPGLYVLVFRLDNGISIKRYVLVL